MKARRMLVGCLAIGMITAVWSLHGMGVDKLRNYFEKFITSKEANNPVTLQAELPKLREAIDKIRTANPGDAGKYEYILNNKLKSVVTPAQTPDTLREFKYTQTEAYLAVPELKDAVDMWFGDVTVSLAEQAKHHALYDSYKSLHGSLTKYKTIIDGSREKEKEFGDYFVFYHASESMWAVYQDFLTNLFALEHGVPVKDDFIFLRDYKIDRWNNLPDINTFLNQAIVDQKLIPRQSGIDWVLSEYNAPLDKGFLVAVNLSFFGETLRPNSSTFKYFIKALSANPGMLASLMANYLRPWVKDSKQLAHYASVFESLLATIETKEGVLYQIFIPQSIVDKVVYLSLPRADIWKTKIEPKSWNENFQRHMSISSILNIYRNNPQQLGPTLDGMEGRIIPRSEFFANPDSGIKIFRYSALSKEKEQEYKERIKSITKVIYEKYIKNAN